MKRLTAMILCVLCFTVVLSGCSNLFSGQYVNVSPYLDDGEKPAGESITVRSYEQMCQALTGLVEDGVEDSVLYVAEITDEECTRYMKNAIQFVLQETPIGAYAVNKIDFDIGTNAGKRAIAVNIQYRHNRTEILRIKQANNMYDVLELVRLALENCEMRLVIRAHDYLDTDIFQYVKNYVNSNPQKCMEEPQLSVVCYPDAGDDRVIEIAFQYQSSREALLSMKSVVTDIFKSAQYYVNTDAEETEKYAQLYTFLMERYDYTYETSITPAYSLLRHGVGDNRAFALVYMAMCRQVGLDCQMVTGTKNGDPWSWNVLLLDGVYYHVDLIACNAQGGFTMQAAENMAGYVWDNSAFETP